MKYFTFPDLGDKFSKEEQIFTDEHGMVKIIIGVDTKLNRVRVSIKMGGALWTYPFTTSGTLEMIEFLKGFEDSIKESNTHV